MTAGSWTLRMSPVSSFVPWPKALLERRARSARRQWRTQTYELACLDFKNLDFMFICSVNEQTQQATGNLNLRPSEGPASTPARAGQTCRPTVAVHSFPIL